MLKIYENLNKKYPKFIYRDFKIEEKEESIEITYQYELNGEEIIPFNHRLTIYKNFTLKSNLDSEVIQNIVFNLGMIEAISYWKLTCSKFFLVMPNNLDEEQINWWQKLYYKGLGEMLYLNKLYDFIKEEEFIKIESIGNKKFQVNNNLLVNGNIIPVGGGKDSIVTLELLKEKKKENNVLLINPTIAAKDSVHIAGYNEEDIILIKRYLDPTLLKLNEEGFLNGHIPLSAEFAFISILTAALKGKKYIVLSNEASANEPTILGTNINHQYSKSFEFEKDFNNYVHKYITNNINYFSFLRPWKEIKIAYEFSKHKKYFSAFRSCNRGSKENIWCCTCPKCLFVYIILAPFLEHSELIQIFGKDLLDDENLLPIFKKLIGETSIKPFECVGTIEEVKYALDLLRKKEKKLPALLKYYLEKYPNEKIHTNPLTYYNKENLLPLEFERMIKNDSK